MKKVVSVAAKIVLCLSLCLALASWGALGLVLAEGYDYEDDYEYEDEYEDESTFYSGMAGDDSTIFAVCLSISPDATQCVLAYGNPGSSRTVLGQYYSEGTRITIQPIDGSDSILLEWSNNSDGSIAIEFINYEGEVLFDGVMDLVDKSKFDETYDMLN